MAGILKALAGTSFLLMVIGLLIFLYSQSFQASAIYPQDVELWNKVLTGYLVIFALAMIGAIVIVPEIVKELARTNYWKSFLQKFVPSAFITFIFLIAIKSFLKGTGNIDLVKAISYMPLSIIVIQAFVITQVEEILFGGLFYTAIKKKYGDNPANYLTIAGFSLFHFAKTGGNIAVMITYVPLRAGWNYLRNNGYPILNRIPVIGQRFFGATPKTQQSNAGSHFAWNSFVIGLINPNF